MARNVVIAQSGGPSAVINNTLRGLIDGCRDHPGTFGRLYGAHHGIEGVLKEELLDLSAQPAEELALLEHTPAAGAIGTCRYKLAAAFGADLERIVAVFAAHDVGYFFYIGGNDSMSTADRVSRLAQEHGVPLVAVGVPKTIDNDLGDAELRVIDHTPGYGSAARFIAYCVQNAEEENRGSSPADPVLVIQVMGRRIGFLPAAARLADPQREMPLQIYLAESGVTLEALGANVLECLARRGRCIVVVSEGFEVGEIGAARDAFGHTTFASSRASVAQVVTNYLNSLKFPVPGKARYQIPGTDQRTAAIYASTVDLREAYEVGRHCVEIAARDGTGWMGTIVRRGAKDYAAGYDKAPLAAMALSERRFPAAWISPSGYDVTDEFIHYAQPLLGDAWPRVPLIEGRQRFARLAPIFADKKLPVYAPESYRGKQEGRR